MCDGIANGRNMKKKSGSRLVTRSPFFGLGLALLLLACGQGASLEPTTGATTVVATKQSTDTPPATETATPTDVLSTPVPVPSKTATASSTPPQTAAVLPTQAPTVTPTFAPDLLVEPSGLLSFNGLTFTLDSALAPYVFPLVVEWRGMFYTQIRFAPEGICREIGCIEVYEVAAYEAALPELPLPPLGAGILLTTQTEGMRFQNGGGGRAILMRAQAGYFANNDALVYEFTGFTDDGRYYVLVQFPLDAPILLSTFDPEQNTNSNAMPVPAELPSDYIELLEVMQRYNQEVAAELGLLAPDHFMPSLTLLDALVSSILVQPPPAGS